MNLLTPKKSEIASSKLFSFACCEKSEFLNTETQNFPSQKTTIQKPLSNIRTEILESLPLIMKQRGCCSQNHGSQLNSLLLEYFIQSELTKISSSASNSVSTSGSQESKETSKTSEEVNKDSDDRGSLGEASIKDE